MLYLECITITSDTINIVYRENGNEQYCTGYDNCKVLVGEMINNYTQWNFGSRITMEFLERLEMIL